MGRLARNNSDHISENISEDISEENSEENSEDIPEGNSDDSSESSLITRDPASAGSGSFVDGGDSGKQAALKKLLNNQAIWRASGTPRQESGIATGYKSLDNLFVGGGWPSRGLTEILHDQPGVGELRLLVPALARLSQTQNRWLLWVAPPYIPYAPALSRAGLDLTRLLIVNPEPADRLWVMEKALASNSCSAVIAWPGQMSNKQLRRLQVASKNGRCLGILYRHSRAASLPSPAELRLRLHARYGYGSAMSDHSELGIQVLKRKGGWATDVFSLTLQDELCQATPDFSELNVQQWQRTLPDLVYMDPHKSRNTYVLQ